MFELLGWKGLHILWDQINTKLQTWARDHLLPVSKHASTLVCSSGLRVLFRGYTAQSPRLQAPLISDVYREYTAALDLCKSWHDEPTNKQIATAGGI